MRLVTMAVAGLLLGTAVPTAGNAQTNTAPMATVLGGPEVGDQAPDFTLPWANSTTTSETSYSYNLRRDRGKVVVLTFYAVDFGPVSSEQLEQLATTLDGLLGDQVTVLGISTSPVATHRRFAEHLELPFRLLSDPDQRVAQLYGTRGPNGQARRAVYVIAPDGTVSYRELRFDPKDAAAYQRVRAAVDAVLATSRQIAE